MGGPTASPVPLGNDRVFLKHDNDASSILSVTAEASGLTPSIVHQNTRGLSKSYSPPALWDNRVYGFTARFLSAVDPDSGEILWRSREPGDGFLLAVDGQLAVLTKKGSLHLGEASPQGWKETDRLDLFEDLAWTPPSFAQGGLYLRSLGELARVDLVRTVQVAAATPGQPSLPPALERLAAEAAQAEDPAATVDRFLTELEVPLIDGEQVVFLWRGAAEDVAIAGDMIGMRREEPMQRLSGTDLWWWQTELDRRARMSYVYFVDDTPTTDPTHPRSATSTVLGPDMNWQRDEPLEMSWFAMPEWPGLETGAAKPPADAPRGRLETLELEVERPGSEDGETIPVPVHVWLPPGYENTDERYPVLFVHNPSARQHGGWPETLDRLVGRSVQPLIAVFVEPPRMQGYAGVFAEQIAPSIDERYRTRSDRQDRANVGMGWEGFLATLVTLQSSDQFGVLGVQSLYAIDYHLGVLTKTLDEVEASAAPMRIYLEWGRWDLISPHEAMNMRTSSPEVWSLLQDKGWQPVGGEVWDSTDWASWRNRTDVLLETLFPLEAAGQAVALGQWGTGAGL
jgi:hypothetical protein